jgi:hypothetical protein
MYLCSFDVSVCGYVVSVCRYHVPVCEYLCVDTMYLRVGIYVSAGCMHGGHDPGVVYMCVRPQSSEVVLWNLL